MHKEPPANLQDLQQLVAAVAQGEAGVQLGRKAMLALAQVVERPGDFALLSITEAAERYGVSASTWTRLAVRLGYGGFAELQHVFRPHFMPGNPHFYAQQTSQALQSQQPSEGKPGVLAPLMQHALHNIQAVPAMVSEAQLQAVAERLAQARRVSVFGQRQMHTVAAYLGYSLGLLRSDVGELGQSQSAIAEGLAQLAPGDVLVVTSVAPYTRMVAEVARVAQEQDLCVVALTDHRASPLATVAKHALFVPHASSFISNSLVAYFLLCEALVNAVAQSLGQQALQAVEAREKLIARLNIEQ